MRTSDTPTHPTLIQTHFPTTAATLTDTNSTDVGLGLQDHA